MKVVVYDLRDHLSPNDTDLKKEFQVAELNIPVTINKCENYESVGEIVRTKPILVVCVFTPPPGSEQQGTRYAGYLEATSVSVIESKINLRVQSLFNELADITYNGDWFDEADPFDSAMGILG